MSGLALQIGHRFSVDLDFFSNFPEAVGADQRKAILEILRDDPSLKITWDKEGTFVANWRNVGVSFFRLDQHPLINPSIIIDKIQVASIEEIGAMKLAAILSRGTRKDYIDLYFILKQKKLMQLFELASKKYPHHEAFPAYAVRALSYFEDAEYDPMPRMIKPVKWAEIKSFLDRQALDMGRERLELEKLWQ
jgi:predicted nucleotidyltransferase component of viral defense system